MKALELVYLRQDICERIGKIAYFSWTKRLALKLYRVQTSMQAG